MVSQVKVRLFFYRSLMKY